MLKRGRNNIFIVAFCLNANDAIRNSNARQIALEIDQSGEYSHDAVLVDASLRYNATLHNYTFKSRDIHFADTVQDFEKLEKKFTK